MSAGETAAGDARLSARDAFMLVGKSRLLSESIAAWMAASDIVCGPRSCAIVPSGTPACPDRFTTPANAVANARTRTLGFDRIGVELQCQLQISRFVARKRDRIPPGVAGRTVR